MKNASLAAKNIKGLVAITIQSNMGHKLLGLVWRRTANIERTLQKRMRKLNPKWLYFFFFSVSDDLLGKKKIQILFFPNIRVTLLTENKIQPLSVHRA